jgi:hypothetical protein
VLDEQRDVTLVFDDKDARRGPGREHAVNVLDRDYRRVSGALTMRYGSA